MNFLASLSFLQTTALFGLLALVVPLLIHLFNPTRGKIVWVGNLGLFKQAQKSSVTEIKITQWLLLILRLLLLTLLVMFMAQLVSQVVPPKSPQTRIYVTADWLYHATPQEVTALFAEDDKKTVFLLNEKQLFKHIGNQHLIVLKPDEIQRLQDQLKSIYDPAHPSNLDAILAELESSHFLTASSSESSESELASIPQLNIVYTTDRLNQYGLLHSALQQNYEWRVKAIDREQEVTQAMRVLLLYAPERFEDQQYLSLALNYLQAADESAIQFQTQLLSDESVQSNLDDESSADELFKMQRPDWLIYLSAKALPAGLQKWIDDGTFLLIDHAVLTLKSVATGHTKLLARPEGLLEVYQSAMPVSTETLIPVWQDAFGQALLIRDGEKRFQWLSRFHPQATNWVVQASFPQALANLLSQAQSNSPTAALSVDEIKRTQKAQATSSQAEVFIDRPLNTWLSLIVILLWLVERWLAERVTVTRKDAVHG